MVRYGHAVTDDPRDMDWPGDFDPDRDPTPTEDDPRASHDMPDDNPSWSLGVTSIPPGLAGGLARCQAAAENVEFDAVNTHHRYSYATAAAVVAMARKAMAAGGLALLRVATTIEPRDERLPRPDNSPAPYATLWARYLLTHESGESIILEASIDMFPGKGRPTDKAQGAAITALGKYVRAGICGIGWLAESGEDIDQRDDGGQQGHASQQSHASQRQQQPQQPPARPKPQPHPNARYQALLDGARQVLRASKMDPERFWALATGMDKMPKEPAPHMLQAIIDAGRNLAEYTQIGELPERAQDLKHAGYLEFCMECEHAWSMDHGEPNDLGRQVDARVLEAGPAPGVKPPEPGPEPEPESAEETTETAAETSTEAGEEGGQ